MKNDSIKTIKELKSEVYNELRKKIKAIIMNNSLSDKGCIERVWETLAFLSACNE